MFEKDAPVVITYHMKVDNDPSKINTTIPTDAITMSFNASTYDGKPYQEVKNEILDMGFTNIELKEVVLINSEYSNGDTTAIRINGSSFRAGDSFDKNAQVTIVYCKVEYVESEYELAFVRSLKNYDLYYMFDKDNKTVVQFGTDDTYLYKGSYYGDFSSGVTLVWDHGMYTDTFIYTSSIADAILIDCNGNRFSYVSCDIGSAQLVLNTRE